ncbi:Uncharacterized protein APZ42_027464 [Daphnia magna]|uniref:Uncharacterized protein n=1 Tax=Daphnia magna TaxID=35525 RepID=A0A0N8DS74_9CRUS|nr:Uncharacterized protein APZ42_027464 [Daphnia magna]
MFVLIKRKQRITKEKAEALCALYLQEARGRCGATACTDPGHFIASPKCASNGSGKRDGNVVLIDPRCSFRHSGNEIGSVRAQHDGTQSQS